jgi:hydrogenase nickel incorporation protein HypB
MCLDCGCDSVNAQVFAPGQVSPAPSPQPLRLSPDSRTLQIHQGLLSKNDRLAAENRSLFREHGLLVLNVLSSPGSGKTALIERLAQHWSRHHHPVGVIVGDLATDNDAQRLQAAGAQAVQIMTGTACHLEADAVAQAAQQLDLEHLDLLVIENVGNLVCPAAYDLGEQLRVVLLSVTEGEDKPLKYPTAFQSADVVILSKQDLADAVEFDRERAIAHIRRMAPQAQLFEVSAKTGAGLEHWLHFLHQQLHRHSHDHQHPHDHHHESHPQAPPALGEQA